MLYPHKIYQNQKTPEEWAEDIRIALEITPVDIMYLPHDCFSKQQGRDSIAEVFKRNIPNISIRRADTLSKGARKNGLALFHMYLSDAPDGIPYFQVHESCQETIKSLPSLVYDEHNVDDVDTDGNDHIYDSVRAVFLEWGKPRGKGGGVRPPYPELRRKAPTILDGRVPALDIQKLIKKPKGRIWKYI